MGCKMCRFWLRDISLPDSIGYCSATGAVTEGNHSCELLRRKEKEPVAIRVAYY